MGALFSTKPAQAKAHTIAGTGDARVNSGLIAFGAQHIALFSTGIANATGPTNLAPSKNVSAPPTNVSEWPVDPSEPPTNPLELLMSPLGLSVDLSELSINLPTTEALSCVPERPGPGLSREEQQAWWEYQIAHADDIKYMETERMA